MTHQYEHAAEWFLRLCETNSWSHGLYTYIAGICYAELSRQHPDSTTYSTKASDLLDKVPAMVHKRKSFGGKKIPFELFVERKVTRFMAQTTGSVAEGITGPVTEEVIYLLCNGQKRMNAKELDRSCKSCDLWESVSGDEEEMLSMNLIRSVIDRNAGRLDEARERIETKIISAANKRVPTGSNDWVAGYAFYEVCRSRSQGNVDGSGELVAETACT
jgi:Iml2/Tetratricopeptide repeat protein 39